MGRVPGIMIDSFSLIYPQPCLAGFLCLVIRISMVKMLFEAYFINHNRNPHLGSQHLASGVNEIAQGMCHIVELRINMVGEFQRDSSSTSTRIKT